MTKSIHMLINIPFISFTSSEEEIEIPNLDDNIDKDYCNKHSLFKKEQYILSVSPFIDEIIRPLANYYK